MAAAPATRPGTRCIPRPRRVAASSQHHCQCGRFVLFAILPWVPVFAFTGIFDTGNDFGAGNWPSSLPTPQPPLVSIC